MRDSQRHDPASVGFGCLHEGCDVTGAIAGSVYRPLRSPPVRAAVASWSASSVCPPATSPTVTYYWSVAVVAPDDARFTVPLYTMAEAARYLGVPATTFGAWVQGYRREFADRPPVTGKPLITGVEPEMRGGPSIPFGGLAEGMFLSGLPRAGIPLQQIRPALDVVRTKIGVEHALASKQLYVAGAQLLWEVSRAGSVDDETRHGARDLIVLRDGQYVFRQVIDRYLRRIEYDDTYALRVHLPKYEVADVAAAPKTNFGRPYFVGNGTPLSVVQGLLEAGESIEDVAGDFDLPVDQVTEVAQREGLLAA